MPFKIQRVPKGLSDLLTIFGGQSPVELEDRVRGVIETIQFYGNQQRQTLVAGNAALAELAFVTVTVNSWFVLFNANAQFVKTATLTALRGSIVIRPSGSIANSNTWATGELGPFGATETGLSHVVFVPAYPMIFPPGTTISARPDVIGTDANVNTSIAADIGVLG